MIAASLPQGWTLQDKSIATIQASKRIENEEGFAISFPLDATISQHGSGVYTVVLLASKNNDGEVSVADKSLFITTSE